MAEIVEIKLMHSGGMGFIRQKDIYFISANHQSYATISRSDVLNDLKTVYTQDTLENAEAALNTFINTWDKRYPKVTEKLKNNPSLFTFLSFPKEIRASIYTTNLIEGFNKHLKRYTKRKEQFPNEDSLIRFIGTCAGDYNQRFQMRIHKGFKIITAELNDMFN